jgi:hypothetical protein
MSLYRNALFELASLNIIDNQCTIVTHPDRFFLYDFYFKVAEKEDITKTIVQVTNQVPWPRLPYNSNDNMVTIFPMFSGFSGYSRSVYFNNTKEPRWVNLVTKFRQLKIEDIEDIEDIGDIGDIYKKDGFILVHFRNKRYEHQYWNETYESLLFIITNIKKRNKNHNIVIFGDVNDEWKHQHVDCFFIDNLQHYCTLLHDESCTHVISQWSGGGQISCYVGHAKLKVLFYFHPTDQDHYFNEITDDIQHNSSINLMTNNNWFDLVNPMQLERHFFKTYHDINFNLF